jgi:hypothetical protein
MWYAKEILEIFLETQKTPKNSPEEHLLDPLPWRALEVD